MISLINFLLFSTGEEIERLPPYHSANQKPSNLYPKKLLLSELVPASREALSKDPKTALV